MALSESDTHTNLIGRLRHYADSLLTYKDTDFVIIKYEVGDRSSLVGTSVREI